MRLFLVEHDAYVIASNELEALNTFLVDYSERVGENYDSYGPYEVSKPLYGSKLLTFPFPIGSNSENFKETSVSTWIELCEGTATVLGYQNT